MVRLAMRFIVMHKADAAMEAGAPPSKQLIDEMGALVGGGFADGTVLDGAGLLRSAERLRLRFRGDACEAVRGPLVGDHELVSGFVMIVARSLEHAAEIARRFAAVLGDVEIEIGPVTEGYDLGLVERPAVIEQRNYLLLFKGDAPAPPGLAPLIGELTRAGVVLKAEGLTPSASAIRLKAGPKARRTWIDGPFTESKELIAGFCILELGSLDEAKAWAERYIDILGDDTEVDVRPLSS